MKSVFVNELGREVWIREGTVDETVLKDTFEGRYHIPPLTEAPAYVLDLGSNIGLTIAHYETMWPEAVIIGYEMDLTNYLLAKKNVSRSVVYHVGIAGENGARQYSQHEDTSAFSLLNESSYGVWTTCWSLDYALDIAIPESEAIIDFVKMDVEGTELEIFKSDNKWSDRVKSILVEVHNGKMQEAWYALLNLGYVCYVHLPHWSAIWATKSL